MGVVNVTPDSFYPASRSVAADEAVARGLAHFANGADVVDVGGESTRPGATPVDEIDELARVVAGRRGTRSPRSGLDRHAEGGRGARRDRCRRERGERRLLDALRCRW